MTLPYPERGQDPLSQLVNETLLIRGGSEDLRPEEAKAAIRGRGVDGHRQRLEQLGNILPAPRLLTCPFSPISTRSTVEAPTPCRSADLCATWSVLTYGWAGLSSAGP